MLYNFFLFYHESNKFCDAKKKTKTISFSLPVNGVQAHCHCLVAYLTSIAFISIRIKCIFSVFFFCTQKNSNVNTNAHAHVVVGAAVRLCVWVFDLSANSSTRYTKCVTNVINYQPKRRRRQQKRERERGEKKGQRKTQRDFLLVSRETDTKCNNTFEK